jgi:hypothetical protein
MSDEVNLSDYLLELVARTDAVETAVYRLENGDISWGDGLRQLHQLSSELSQRCRQLASETGVGELITYPLPTRPVLESPPARPIPPGGTYGPG